MAAVLALVSAVGYGISDFSGGLASRRAPAIAIVLVSNSLTLVIALLAVALLPGSAYHLGDVTWGIAAGTVGVVGVVLLYRGLAIGRWDAKMRIDDRPEFCGRLQARQQRGRRARRHRHHYGIARTQYARVIAELQFADIAFHHA